MEERSNVWCTNCAREFIATLDLSLNGNHEITCPHCAHVHYRVVLNGRVTEDRWASSAGLVGPIYRATTSTTVNVSTTFSTSTVTTGTMSSWLARSDFNLT